MGLWDRFTKKKAPSVEPPPPQEAVPARSAPEVARLSAVGEPDGPSADEALALFRLLRASPDEGRGVDAVVAASSRRPVPEALRVAVAAALSERGEPERALSLLITSRGVCASPDGRLLAADLLADRGELAEALSMIERVLVVDLDYAGARERHTRWRAALGLEPAGGSARVAGSANGATLVVREPDAPFSLLREVARGGSAAVYEAEDRELGRRVALKVYHHPERDRAQLLHEARVAGALAGAGVVQVLDVDPDHGWLALEWAALGSLRQHLRDKDRAALDPLSRWAIPLATSLARVHAAGWVHQDVKPANVLLAASHRLLLADFGTARTSGEPSLPGSLGYVSPERLAGRVADPRDDVFGFGRILEDALACLDRPAGTSGWQALAAACTGPDTGRPADARALLIRLRVETGASG